MCLDEAVIELEAPGAGLRTLTHEHSLIFFVKCERILGFISALYFQGKCQRGIQVTLEVVLLI